MAEFHLYEGDCLASIRKLPDACIDSVVCDPPYGLSTPPDMVKVLTAWLAGEDYVHKAPGFMGHEWDSFVPGPKLWKEVFRVLKPGGHLVAFSGTRTYDIAVLAVRLAGFEIRDQLGWVYGCLDDQTQALTRRGWIGHRDLRADDEVMQWDSATGALSWVRPLETMTYPFDGEMVTIENRHTRQVLTPNHRVYAKVRRHSRHAKPTAYEVLEAREIGDRRGKDPDSEATWQRVSQEFELTTPASPEAQAWDGWGTALKPAWEPIVLARKPLQGTVAANVLAHGTGGLNIDGCRVGTEGGTRTMAGDLRKETVNALGKGIGQRGGSIESIDAGRFPANFIHDGSDEVLALFPDTGKSSGGVTGKLGYHGAAGSNAGETAGGFGDSGSAARFFYCAKASKADRAGSKHPTVKPIKLMRWLCKLVTPPGGAILDPFAGSGTTGAAALAEGFNVVLCEMDPQFAADIRRRLSGEPVEDLGGAGESTGPLPATGRAGPSDRQG